VQCIACEVALLLAGGFFLQKIVAMAPGFRRANFFTSSGNLADCHDSQSSVAQNTFYIVLSDQWVPTKPTFRQH